MTVEDVDVGGGVDGDVTSPSADVGVLAGTRREGRNGLDRGRGSGAAGGDADADADADAGNDGNDGNAGAADMTGAIAASEAVSEVPATRGAPAATCASVRGAA